MKHTPYMFQWNGKVCWRYQDKTVQRLYRTISKYPCSGMCACVCVYAGVLNSMSVCVCVCVRMYTVELLIKATPDARTPLYKGHFAESQMHFLVRINP